MKWYKNKTRSKEGAMETEDSYSIGYGKPPRHSQFKKGQSGNPGGKRRPVAASATAALADALARRVTVANDEGEARMSQLEALMQALVGRARNGDARCLRLVLDRLDDIEASPDLKDAFETLCRKTARDDGKGARDTEEHADPPPEEKIIP
jgi:hypothetical protein